MTDEKINDVYALDNPEDLRAYYDRWAGDYDRDVDANGYATPDRCAAALRAAGLGADAPILDMGCGTGLSGRALATQGFTTFDGTDVSDGMLSKAQARGIYRNVFNSTDLDARPGDYAAVLAAGVIGPGAAEPWLFDRCLDLLATGGLFCFSYNHHAMNIPEYPEKLSAALSDGRARTVSEEYGDHLPAMGINSTVYLLEKT